MFQCLNVRTGVINAATSFCNKGEEDEDEKDREEENMQEKNCISHVYTTKNIHIDNWTAVAFLL